MIVIEKMHVMNAMTAAIKAAGIPCYGADVKIGVCAAPYAVVYDGGAAALPGTRGMLGHQRVNVMILAPSGDDAALSGAVAAVCGALRGVRGIRMGDEITSVDTDQDRRAMYQTTQFYYPIRLY